VSLNARGPACALALAVASLLAPARAEAAEDRAACVEAYERAQQLRRVNDLVAARAELVRCEATCPRKFVTDCTVWRGEVESFLPTIVVTARTAAGAPAVIDDVFIDGRRVASPWRPLWLTPGEHVVRVQAGAGTGETRVALRAEEHGREVVVAIAPVEAASGAATASSAATATPPSAPGAAADARTGSRVPAYALIGGGALALAAASALGIFGHVERARLERTCSPACAPDDASGIRTAWLIAGGLAGAGAAALVLAWLVWPRGSSAAASLQLAPSSGALRLTF
jgi:hypothetical protein